MATYVYEAASGRLESWCPEDEGTTVAAPEVLEAKGLAMIQGQPALDATHAWDEGSRGVVVVAAPVVPILVDKGSWVLRFTPTEFDAITSSTNVQIRQWIFALQHADVMINLASAQFQTGVPALAQLGLVTADRVAALLAP